MTRVRPLWIGVAYLAIYVAGSWLLATRPFARALFGNLALLAAPALVCGVILARRRQWSGCQRLFWDTFGAGVALWGIGQLGWTYDEIVLGKVEWLRWHTVFSLCGGIGPLVALLARPHRGPREEVTGTVGLVIASYGLLAIFIYSYYVLVPSLVVRASDAAVNLLSLVQLHRALLFAATALAFLLARGTPWRAAYLYLVVATGVGLALRSATNLAILGGTYQSGSMDDLAWIVPFLLYAGAALAAPPSVRGGAEEPLPRALHAAISAVPVVLIPIVGYGSLIFWPSGSSADPFLALLTGVMTIAGLGLLTLRLAAQGGELQRADARHRLLVAATEQTADLILITRADGLFEYANDAFVRALGYSREELAGRTSIDLMERGFERLGAHVRSELRERGIWRGTLVRRRRDGSTFPASCTVVALEGENGQVTHFVGVERDISEELKLRDQLVHSERLSAIGELVAGVAHEINNPLQTIVGAAELMMEENGGSPSRRDLEMVRREATRAGQIVRNLLSFIRRSAPDRVAADLNAIARTTAELRDFHLRQRNVTLSLDLHPAPLPVLVNREEVQQIVLNLLLNAEQAIIASGREGRITIRSRPGARHHVLEVADDGPGVAADLRGRIFEPFFTTKDVGQGTGLGLSLSHGIATSHGGMLELADSAAGACFRLSLPAHAQEPAEAAVGRRSSAAPLEGPPGPPLALVIDDEPPIRDLLARLLERRGYEVAQAESGQAALEMSGRRQLRLVLCDFRMPGMDGIEIHRRLVQGRPDLASRFVFITGDRAAVSSEHPELSGVRVLAKPFSAADLDGLLAQLPDAAIPS